MHKALDVKGIVATGIGILNSATETAESMGGGEELRRGHFAWKRQILDLEKGILGLNLCSIMNIYMHRSMHNMSVLNTYAASHYLKSYIHPCQFYRSPALGSE